MLCYNEHNHHRSFVQQLVRTVAEAQSQTLVRAFGILHKRRKNYKKQKAQGLEKKIHRVN